MFSLLIDRNQPPVCVSAVINEDVSLVLPQGFPLSLGLLGPGGLCRRERWVSLPRHITCKDVVNVQKYVDTVK